MNRVMSAVNNCSVCSTVLVLWWVLGSPVLSVLTTAPNPPYLTPTMPDCSFPRWWQYGTGSLVSFVGHGSLVVNFFKYSSDQNDVQNSYFNNFRKQSGSDLKFWVQNNILFPLHLFTAVQNSFMNVYAKFNMDHQTMSTKTKAWP